MQKGCRESCGMAKVADPLEQDFDRAIAAGDLDAVEALLPRIMKKKPKRIFAAVEAGDVALVRLLLDAGAPLEGRHHGGTPLLMAIFELTEIAGLEQFKTKREGLVAILELLIERGADVNVRAPDGVSALRLATTLPDSAIADRLRGQGATP
jgi:hypothetical protein